jgi:hypothetical protein
MISSDENCQFSKLVWLDGDINVNAQNLEIQATLCLPLGFTKTFVDADECIDYITRIQDEKFVLIISGRLSRHIILVVHEFSQVSAVYVRCTPEDKTRVEQWIVDLRKVIWL